ncbi:MAG: oligoendopeptidase F [Pirellulaceae bacterium]
MGKTRRLLNRDQVASDDTWDLASLFQDDAAWEEAFQRYERRIKGYEKFRGQLGTSAAVLAKCLEFDSQLDRLGERLGVYAFLRTAEDQTNSGHQRMLGRFQNVATRAGQAASFIRPELLALPAAKLRKLMAHESIKFYRLLLERLVRFQPHTLNHREEELLAMQGEMAQAASRTFRQLYDADLKFGFIRNEQGEKIELTNATFTQLLHSPKRTVRREAFHQYYAQFAAHENTLAATLSGSILKDVYYARARQYPSSLDAALFPDNVPRTVYDNLIDSVHQHLPAVHHYYEVRRRKMRLKDIHLYDTYVPILSQFEVHRTWEQAVQMVLKSLEPLGSDYCGALEKGLQSRWCDRYPNRGKQSGAFSCGSYDANPYILMNYRPQVLDDVFTLAHEAGHSMHSFLSARNQSFIYYDYTIFVAEVASTFNEQLLNARMLSEVDDDRQRAYLINREVDAIRGTVIRQTMFAEFEKMTHALAESGEPLTVQALKDTYRGLLEKYFGPAFQLDPDLSLESLRIPHFYRAFYVYKYATGLSAAIALSQRVLRGGRQELADYLGFLQSGCAKDPLDLLRDAGVDMASPQPVNTALEHFAKLVQQLDELLS